MATNPAFIPRNHLVEEALAAAARGRDLEPFEKMLAVVTRPFEDQPENARYALPAQPHEAVTQTFCGT